MYKNQNKKGKKEKNKLKIYPTKLKKALKLFFFI